MKKGVALVRHSHVQRALTLQEQLQGKAEFHFHHLACTSHQVQYALIRAREGIGSPFALHFYTAKSESAVPCVHRGAAKGAEGTVMSPSNPALTWDQGTTWASQPFPRSLCARMTFK